LLEQQEQPAVTLYSKVCQIDKFLRDPQLQLDFDYYVKHQLAPALQRVLDLVPVKLPLTNKFKPHLQCIGYVITTMHQIPV
jgi:DNA polymerase elongation subunit (family B)